MEYVVAVFVNRSQSQMFSKSLYGKGVPSSVISTPRDLGVSCGLSVRFNMVHLPIAKMIINSGRYNSFKNFYKVLQIGHNKYSYIRV